jgi:trk system potassium uptake protein TrkH
MPTLHVGPATRLRTIAAYTGMTCALVGCFMLATLLALPVWPEELAQAPAFLLPGLGLALGGLATWRLLAPRAHRALSLTDGGSIVLLSWVVCCLIGAWPFRLVGLNFTQAVFEAVSGFTTTGLSVVDVTRASHLVLLWRSLMQLAGGAGLAIIMLAAIAGPAGTGLSGAEGRQDQLAPHVRKSAVLVLATYAVYALAGVPAYRLAGMSWFDAVNHTFAAISTGGFSTRVQSIGYWDSPAVELISCVLMFFGNLNFLTAYLALTGRFRAVAKNSELRCCLVLFVLGTGLVYLLATQTLYPGLGKQIRVAAFETMSALTTTGFSTVGYGDWPAFGWFALILLMLVGGGTGSTAGGIKQYRVALLAKAVFMEFRRAMLPRTSVTAPDMWMGEAREFIGDAGLRRTGAFLFLYLSVYSLGVGIMTAYGYPLKDCLFEFASSLSTVGLSIGLTVQSTPPVVLWTETAGMFLGRLEFFIVFIGLANGLGLTARILRSHG